MAKTQILKYLINLPDQDLVDSLNTQVDNASGQGPLLVVPWENNRAYILRAPYNPGPPEGGAAVQYAMALGTYPPALPVLDIGDPMESPSLSSEWFTNSNTFPRDVAQFTRDDSWWIGGVTKFYWCGRFAYAPDPATPTPPIGPEPTIPCPMPNRLWLMGNELPNSGDSNAANGLTASREGGRWIDSIGYARRPTNVETTADVVDQLVTATTLDEVWVRFRFRIRTAADVTTHICGGSGSGTGDGMYVDVTPANQLALFSNPNGSGTVFNLLDSGSTTLVVGDWYKLDILFVITNLVSPQGQCQVYLNGALEMSGSMAIGGSVGLRHLTRVVVGKSGSPTLASTLQIDYDDIVVSETPGNKRVTNVYSGVTAYAAGDIVLAPNGGYYVCILASTGNQPPNTTFWTRLVDGRDWSAGSRVFHLQPADFSADTDLAAWAVAAGQYQALPLQPNVVGIGTDALASTTALSRLGYTTDVLRSAGGLPGAAGYACFTLQVNSHRGTNSGQLGYNLNAAGATMAAITESSGFAWSRLMINPTGRNLPLPFQSLDVLYDKGNDGVTARVKSLHVLMEAIGTFATEDLPPDANPSDVPDPQSSIHNAWYPRTPWAREGISLGPVVIYSGTYTGNGVGQFIALPSAPCIVIIRPLTGSSGGVVWWGTQLAGFTFPGALSVGFNTVLPMADQDPNFVPASPDADQQMQFRLWMARNNTQINANGVTYHIVAIMDPAARFHRTFAFNVPTTSLPATIDIGDTFLPFVPVFLMVARENIGTTATAVVYLKGAGHAADEACLVTSGAQIASALTFGVGNFIIRSGLLTSTQAQWSGFALRTDDGNANPDNPRVMAVNSYVGNGVSPRTIVVAPASGRRPLHLIVRDADGSGVAVYRDASHTGTTSSDLTGTAIAANGIRAGGIDTFDVGSQINANGVTYTYWLIPGDTTAGNGGWSPDGTFVPVPSDSINPSDWTEPEIVVGAAGAACLVNLPLGD